MSIFRYPGGKSKPNVQTIVLSHAPEHFSSYREPFVGGGGIFDAIPCGKERWINDKNVHLMAVYLALQNRPREFINLCRQIMPAQPGEPEVRTAGGTVYPKRLYEFFYQLRDNPNADLALRFFFINRTSYWGRVVLDGNRVKRTMFSNPAGWNIVNTDQLERTAEHLKDAKITCGDYDQLFTAPGTDPWIYVDAPYVRDTLLPKSAKLYQHGFEMQDHRRLAEVSHRCPHKICLSYDDCPLIRELYRGMFIHPVTWKYCGTSLAKKVEGQELLITNYPIVHANI